MKMKMAFLTNAVWINKEKFISYSSVKASYLTYYLLCHYYDG